MQKLITFLSLIVLIVEAIITVHGQLSFPENFEIDKKKSNLAGRIPLFSPSRCGKHELLYPGDQADDWICDCAPGAIYYPESDACFLAWYRGPCEKDQFLVILPNKIIPECKPNVCKVDGQIPIKEGERISCYEVGKNPPCKNPELSYVFGINPRTLNPDCIKLSINLQTRLGDADELQHEYGNLAEIDRCARGTQRSQEGRC